MARCFACDIPVEQGYDKKTDRWYCQKCFEPTNKVLMKLLDEEMDSLFGPGEKMDIDIDDDYWQDDFEAPSLDKELE